MGFQACWHPLLIHSVGVEPSSVDKDADTVLLLVSKSYYEEDVSNTPISTLILACSDTQVSIRGRERGSP